MVACRILKFSVIDKVHKPLVAACKVVAAGNRIVMQPENQGGSYIEDVRSKRRKRFFERSGVYVFPWWVVEHNSTKRLAHLVKSCPNDQQVYPQAQSHLLKHTLMSWSRAC